MCAERKPSEGWRAWAQENLPGLRTFFKRRSAAYERCLSLLGGFQRRRMVTDIQRDLPAANAWADEARAWSLRTRPASGEYSRRGWAFKETEYAYLNALGLQAAAMLLAGHPDFAQAAERGPLMHLVATAYYWAFQVGYERAAYERRGAASEGGASPAVTVDIPKREPACVPLAFLEAFHDADLRL